MKRLAYLPTLFLLLPGVMPKAWAEPAWGGNCLSCHSQWQTDTLFVFGEDTTADPDESGTGAPDRGPLPVFQAVPGTTRRLLAEVTGLSADDTYAVELRRLRFPGVEAGKQLTYTGDCVWPEWGENARYYSDPVVRHRWGTGPTTFTFDLDVEPGTGYDYYDLVFAVAGKFKDGSGLFYAEEHFYLEALVMPGDLDEDGDVDLVDFGTFLGCLNGPGNATPPGGCPQEVSDSCDLDEDNDVDLGDFAIFQDVFTGDLTPLSLASSSPSDDFLDPPTESGGVSAQYSTRPSATSRVSR